jgi:hypothetical protein
MPTKEIQQEQLTTDDLAPYRGTWVAIRDGKVIANAIDAVELRDRDDIRDGDTLMLVPSSFGSALVL